MKKIYVVFLFIHFISLGQIINIPDPTFKNLLLSSPTNTISGGILIDVNNNGEIEQSEALLVYYLVLPPGNITDLTGIEYFTNLEELSCANNLLTSADLSDLSQLSLLHIGGNQLTSLNLNGLTNLYFLLCSGNQLTQLDFSTLTALEVTICTQNLFTEIDFSNNPLFDQLACAENPNLTTIKINNNYPQIFTQTPFNSCWNENPNLSNICVDENEVTALQNFLANCTITQPINIYTDCTLSNEDFVATTFKLAPNPTSETVFFDNSVKQFNTVSIFNYLGQEILSKNLEPVFKEKLDLSGFEKGVYIVKLTNERESVSVKVIKK
jgi:hypothetical protein